MDNFQKLPRTQDEAHLWSDGYYRTEPEPESNKKDGLIYSPPAWKVCKKCNGAGELDSRIYTMLSSIPAKQKCTKCKGTGRIPIHYTPEQWQEAGGVLSDDTPVWAHDEETAFSIEGWTGKQFRNAKLQRYFDKDLIVAIPGQNRPLENWRPE